MDMEKENKTTIINKKYVAIPRHKLFDWMVGLGILDNIGGVYKVRKEIKTNLEHVKQWTHFEIED